MTEHEERIQFGSREIAFRLSYHDRKSLGITVHPDQTIRVKAPHGASLEKIKQMVRKRAPWILRQQRFFLSFEPFTPPRKYISGETHLYLGRQYRLKVYSEPGDKVKLTRGYLRVYTLDRTKVETLVKAWYQAKARQRFPELVQPWIERFKKYGVQPQGLDIRWMEKRWGSCTPRGKIILNVELIKAPKRCIEYVILHELCHLVHHNHGAAFFKLQENEMPDWENWKDRLEKGLA